MVHLIAFNPSYRIKDGLYHEFVSFQGLKRLTQALLKGDLPLRPTNKYMDLQLVNFVDPLQILR